MSPTKQSARATSSPPASATTSEDSNSNSNSNSKSYTRQSSIKSLKEMLREIEEKIHAKLDAQLEKNAMMAAEIKELEETKEYTPEMQKLKDEFDEEGKKGRELEGKLREMEGLAIRTKRK